MSTPKTYEPTPETIASECVAIRATWSDRESRKREVRKPTRWEITVPKRPARRFVPGIDN